MSSNNPSIGSQPYRPAFTPSYSNPSPGSITFNPSVPGMPSHFQPYPTISAPSYPGSSSGHTTSFPTYGSGQSTIASHSGSSGTSYGSSVSVPSSFRSSPPSSNPSTPQVRSPNFSVVTPVITPSWVNNPSLPTSLSTSYTSTSNAGFSPPSLQPLNMVSSFPSSFTFISLPSISFGGTSFFPQPPSLTGRIECISPVSTGFRGTLPSGNQELSVWTPHSFSTERSPFIPQTFGSVSGNPSLPQHQTRFSIFENHLDSQRSLRLEFEETIKIMYQMDASPERPFSSWQNMGLTPLAIQIGPHTTLFVDPLNLSGVFQGVSFAQVQETRASQEGHSASLGRAIAIVSSTENHTITKYVGIFLKNTLLTIQQLNPNPRHLHLTDKKSLSEAWETEAVPAIHQSIDSAYGTNIGANYNPNNDGRIQQAVQNFFLDPLWLFPMGRLVEGVNLTIRGTKVAIQEIGSAIKTARIALETPGAMKPAFATAGNMMAKNTKAIEGAAVVQRSIATEDIAQHTAKGFFGKKGFELKFPNYQDCVRSADQIINGRKYVGHALDQMQNRGIPPSAVENAIKTGIRTPDPIPGRFQCHDPINKITVIIEEATGNVITTIGK